MSLVAGVMTQSMNKNALKVPLSVLHIITDLQSGGAENMLLSLVREQRKLGLKTEIVALKNGGEIQKKLENDGIRVIGLNIKGGIDLLGAIKAVCDLRKIIKRDAPNVVQTWLYHADLIGGIVARLCGVKRIFWGIHNTRLAWKGSNKVTFLLPYLLAIFSWFVPTGIIACAESAKKYHVKIGYCRRKINVIENGIDCNYFSADARKRNEWRRTNNIPEDLLCLGVIARNDPIKGHQVLFRALKKMLRCYPHIQWRCFLVGKGVESFAEALKENELKDNVVLYGESNEIDKVLNGIDITVLPSLSEALPNVLVESISTGTICVATDVGDVRNILDKYGILIPTNDPESLIQGILTAKQIIEKSSFTNYKNQMMESARARFDISVVARKYLQTWY